MSDKPQNGSYNRNRNNNRQGGSRDENRNNRGNNNRNRSNNRNPQNRNGNGGSQRRSAPKPLTFWQKILSFFGVKPKQQAKPTSSRQPQNSSTRSNQQKEGNKPATKKARQPQKVDVTTGRLYVGNLSYETTEYDLEELFKGNGSVKSVEIIYNRHTHKSKGYGFIEMVNVDDAKNAVKVHHDQPFMGRNMIVNGAKHRQHDEKSEQSAA